MPNGLHKFQFLSSHSLEAIGSSSLILNGLHDNSKAQLIRTSPTFRLKSSERPFTSARSSTSTEPSLCSPTQTTSDLHLFSHKFCFPLTYPRRNTAPTENLILLLSCDEFVKQYNIALTRYVLVGL